MPSIGSLFIQRIFSTIRSDHDEANLSAQQNQTRPYPRLPCQNEDPRRPRRAERPPRQGPQEACRLAGLIPRTHDFPRDRRLGKAADFRHVFEKAQKSTDAYLTVLARRTEKGYPRLGLAISKKTIRNATDRNRIKRLVRESFRLQQHALGSLDIVVMARGGARQADRKTLRLSLEKHWEILIKRCDSRWCNSSSSTAT